MLFLLYAIFGCDRPFFMFSKQKRVRIKSEIPKITNPPNYCN